MESRIHVPLKKTGIQHPETTIHRMGSRIQDCLVFRNTETFHWSGALIFEQIWRPLLKNFQLEGFFLATMKPVIHPSLNWVKQSQYNTIKRRQSLTLRKIKRDRWCDLLPRGDSHTKVTRLLIVCRFYSHLGCFGRKVTKYAHSGIA